PFRERLEGLGIPTNPAPEVLWNFEKFLVNKNGEVVARFAPNLTADDEQIVKAVEAELAK
ncbi:glutathione peroxidase, partial [Acinetobacter baumannii]|nr:glutathione peroxidase [Acinetobacter baumannii]ELN8944442.1 glutathione peroxidase [Acinetobacter baumannii]